MSPVRWRPAVAIIAILIAGAAAQALRSQATDALVASWDPARAQAIPEQISDWRMIADVPADQRALEEFQRLAAVERMYARADSGSKVMVWLVYGLTMQAMHFPERCLRANGWNMTGMRSVSLASAESERIEEATLINSEREPDRRLQQLYLFADAEGTSSDWFSLVWRKGRSGVMQEVLCMVIVVRELTPGETEDESLEDLQGFLVDLLPHVHQSLQSPDSRQNDEKMQASLL